MRELRTLNFNAYSTILFDADDTLFDFGAAESYALRMLFSELGLELTPEIDAVYQEINKGLWKSLEQGSITKKQLTDSRFALLIFLARLILRVLSKPMKSLLPVITRK